MPLVTTKTDAPIDDANDRASLQKAGRGAGTVLDVEMVPCQHPTVPPRRTPRVFSYSFIPSLTNPLNPSTPLIFTIIHQDVSRKDCKA